MLLVFGPMLLSGLTYTLGNLGDGRLVAFTLEHGYGWLAGNELHRDFWRAPMFHPYDKSATLSDVMIGYGPLYWPWRMLGLAADTSFQLWMLAVATLNFAVAYAFAIRFVRVGVLGASVGAYLFAFGNPKLVQFSHQQLAPLFYVLLAMICLHAVLVQTGAPRTAWRERLWIGTFFSTLVGQAYGAFYPFFFFGLVLAAATAWVAFFRAPREAVLALVRRRGAWILLCGVLTTAALAPLVTQSLETADDVGGYAFVTCNVPVPQS
jgi:hypothetical protein